MDEEEYKEIITNLLFEMNDINACNYCTNRVECNGKDCPYFCQGDFGFIGAEKINFKWTCEDFDMGTCGALENTPCAHCVKTEDAEDFELDIEAIKNDFYGADDESEDKGDIK
jgi:hypothetical protein